MVKTGLGSCSISIW